MTALCCQWASGEPAHLLRTVSCQVSVAGGTLGRAIFTDAKAHARCIGGDGRPIGLPAGFGKPAKREPPSVEDGRGPNHLPQREDAGRIRSGTEADKLRVRRRLQASVVEKASASFGRGAGVSIDDCPAPEPLEQAGRDPAHGTG
ncbi:hypothetical protein PMIN06_010039 [Paraphaeosphaeria minitans]